MKKLMLVAACLAMSAPALAEQASILCVTETKEYIDIVAKDNNNAVLVQINGGSFLDGYSEFADPLLKVIVPLDDGTIALAYNVENRRGALIASINGKKTKYDLTCKFR